MQLAITKHSALFSTCPQIQPEDMSAIAALGFKTVMNNRPDNEGGTTQPSSAAIQKMAEQLGLTYSHIPVTPGQITPSNIADCKALLTHAPTPILGFCKSGNRASSLYQMANPTSI